MMLKAIFLISIMISNPLSNDAVVFHETAMGVVGGGNYTYYSLSKSGSVMIFLHSHQGDADLYVSSRILKPTYDIENHDLQSTTCGLDYVHLLSNDQRPISIAIYGHPSSDLSVYELQVMVEDVPQELENLDYPDIRNKYFEGLPAEDASDHTESTSHPKPDHAVEEESIIWTIIVGILRVLLDILVD